MRSTLVLLWMAAILVSAPAGAVEPLSEETYEPFDISEVTLDDAEMEELEELWQMARSWGVGALQKKVPEAREELARRGARAAAFLVDKLDDEYSLARRAHEQVFTKIGPPAIPMLAGQLDSESETVRRTVIGVLAKIRHVDAADALVAFLEGGAEGSDRLRACMGLSGLGDERVVGLIAPYREDGKENLRLQYCVVMKKFAPEDGVEPLLDLLDDEFFSVRYAAQEALVAIGEPAVEPLMARLEGAGDTIAANHAVMALGALGDRRAWKALAARLDSEDWAARGFAAQALGRIDARRAERLFDRVLAGETDPFVLGVLAQAREADGD